MTIKEWLADFTGWATEGQRPKAKGALDENPEYMWVPRAGSGGFAAMHRVPTPYRLDVDVTQRGLGVGAEKANYHWRVTEVATGRVMAYGRAVRMGKAYRQGNRALSKYLKLV